QPAHEIEPVLVGELHVENDEIDVRVAQHAHHAVAVRHRTDPEMVAAEIVRHQVTHRGVVVDDENVPGGGARGPGAPAGNPVVLTSRHTDGPTSDACGRTT